MEVIISYIAKVLVLITSMVLYIYLFSAIIPKFIMRLKCKKENTRDRGIKKFIYDNGRCVLYEPELSVREYVSNYALYTEDGYKYIKCKTARELKSIRYDVYVFDNRNKLIDIVNVNETLKEKGYTSAVMLPPETSYVRFVLRRADAMYSSNKVIATYSPIRYCICAGVVAIATAIEATFIYSFVREIYLLATEALYKNGLRLQLTIIGPVGMIFMILGISLIAAGLTVLAYRRNCKKVINR